MSIKSELEIFREDDVYSFIMFVLFQMSKNPKYSSISELSYILDKDNMLKLCEYFGGTTITIPTIEELESVLMALQVYKEIEIDHKESDSVMASVPTKIKNIYSTICSVMNDYSFGVHNDED